MSDGVITLAIVGHTNTGKTSLMRTLTRDRRFGEVSDRPATTRDVHGVDLLVDDAPLIRLFDTPGLEDPQGLVALLRQDNVADPVTRIERFLTSDHGSGYFEQEAKVLRQLIGSDAALYVVDVREPLLDKHHLELRLLADCGRPVLPVLNFLADPQAETEAWRQGLARSGLHVVAECDTVVFDEAAEQQVFGKLQTLLEAQQASLARYLRHRRGQREQLLRDACGIIARLLIDSAGARMTLTLEADLARRTDALRQRIIDAEQTCVDALLDLFAFDLGAYQPPALPLHQGRWMLDPFDPEALRLLGIRTGSAVAAGAAGGLSVDALLGGASMGTGAMIGAGVGALASAYRTVGRRWLDPLRGHRTLVVEEQTLTALTARQLALLQALLRRGHASVTPVRLGAVTGWPSAAVRRAVLRARAHPEWSSLNGAANNSSAARDALAELLHGHLMAIPPADSLTG